MPNQTLEKTLKSLIDKVDHVIIGVTKDAKVDVKLPDWCVARSCSGRFDEWRNNKLNSQTLIINAGEELEGDLSVEEGTYRVYVMDDQVVSKETRIVDKHDGKFINPVYECFDTKEIPPLVPIFIKPNTSPSLLELVEKWKKEEPGTCEVDYYKAFELLKKGDYKGFIKNAEYFLFRCGEKNKSSAIMTKYYLGTILLMMGEVDRAATYFVSGLQESPMMAEFWCGLGDCFLKSGHDERAKRMYKNAIFMGKRRDPSDDLPITVPLYDMYPETMINHKN